MITGDTEQSFRKTSIWLNLIRYQQENGTPHRTLHDQTWKEGAELIDYLKQKADLTERFSVLFENLKRRLNNDYPKQKYSAVE